MTSFGWTVEPEAGSADLVSVYPGIGCSVTTSGGVIGGSYGGVAVELAWLLMILPSWPSPTVTV